MHDTFYVLCVQNQWSHCLCELLGTSLSDLSNLCFEKLSEKEPKQRKLHGPFTFFSLTKNCDSLFHYIFLGLKKVCLTSPPSLPFLCPSLHCSLSFLKLYTLWINLYETFLVQQIVFRATITVFFQVPEFEIPDTIT